MRCTRAWTGAALCAMAMSSTCSFAGSEPSPPSLEQALGEAGAMMDRQETFRAEHPFVGVTASAYIDQLRRESFACRIQYQRRTMADSLGRFQGRLQPVVECVQDAAALGPCKTFRVGLRPDWSDSHAPISALSQQLSRIPVADAVFVCNLEGLSSADREALRRGVKDGTVVPLP